MANAPAMGAKHLPVVARNTATAAGGRAMHLRHLCSQGRYSRDAAIFRDLRGGRYGGGHLGGYGIPRLWRWDTNVAQGISRAGLVSG